MSITYKRWKEIKNIISKKTAKQAARLLTTEDIKHIEKVPQNTVREYYKSKFAMDFHLEPKDIVKKQIDEELEKEIIFHDEFLLWSKEKIEEIKTILNNRHKSLDNLIIVTIIGGSAPKNKIKWLTLEIKFTDRKEIIESIKIFSKIDNDAYSNEKLKGSLYLYNLVVHIFDEIHKKKLEPPFEIVPKIFEKNDDYAINKYCEFIDTYLNIKLGYEKKSPLYIKTAKYLFGRQTNENKRRINMIVENNSKYKSKFIHP